MMQYRTAPRTVEVSHGRPPASIAAIQLMRHLGFDEPGGLVQVQTARLRTPGQKKAAGGGDNWSDLGERWYGPDELAEAAKYGAWQDSATNTSGVGREAFICAHRLIDQRYGRKKDNAASVRALFADIDEGDIDKLKPTALLETSPGRYQGYWRLNRWIAPHKAEELSKRVALHIGADGSGFDLTQVLRLPDCHNWSRPDYPLVRLVYIDDETTYDVADLDKILPPLPKPAAAVHVPSEALSDDDSELIGKLGRLSPVAGRLFAGDTSDYVNEHGVIDPSDADWGLGQDLVRACGGDVDRAERLMRQSPLVRPKWDEPRGDVSMLRYMLQRVKEQPSSQNASAYRFDDAATWPAAADTDGTCSDHCRHFHPTDSALHRQVKLINQTLQLEVSPIVKLTLLWLMVLVGYAQSHGENTLQTSALSIGKKLKLSAQVIRPVLHGLARNDFTREGKGDVFHDERGLFDLDSTRVPEAGEYCRVFNITPLTEGAYTGFLEAAVAVAPELLPVPKREPRQKHEEVRPPAEVVQIDGCPGAGRAHPMRSRDVICGCCGDGLIEEVRYGQNATPYRFETPPPPWDTSSATPYRFEPRVLEAEDLKRLNALYDRARP